ncbi:alpha/beta hydrolase [Nannocystis pusilla]|uniref:alpha/beta hydrolase n=1 Tax=Nannocystis pusilla TaxID=889268 RepID=UPI003BEF8D83
MSRRQAHPSPPSRPPVSPADCPSPVSPALAPRSSPSRHERGVARLHRPPRRRLPRGAARGYVGSTPAHDPRASPMLGIPAHLPPLLIQVGSEEIVYDDAVGYAQRARAAGHEVTLQEWTGMHHVFQLNVEQLEGARHALDAAAAFLDEHMKG